MNNLTEKVVNYKKTNDKNLLEEIFELLQSTIKEKAKFIYSQKWFPNNLYIKCKYCQKCKYNKEDDSIIKEFEKRKICEKCVDCTCKRGYFNLKTNNLCHYKDVEQDLFLEVLRLINEFDIKIGDFDSYLFCSLWNWRPSFITLDFVENINHHSLFKQNEDGEDIILEKEDKADGNQIKSNLNIEDIFNECKTANERKICNLLFENPNMTMRELGEKLKMTKQNIYLILKKLRKRIKNHLTK